MKGILRAVALLLVGIGLVACVAGLVGVWVARGYVLHGSEEVCDAMDAGLQRIEPRVTQATALVDRTQVRLASIADEVESATEDGDRATEVGKKLQRVGDEIAEHLERIEGATETIESAVVLLQVAARISKSLRSTDEPAADDDSPDDSADRSRALAAVAIVVSRLNNLREILTTIRDDRPVQTQIVDSTLKALGEVGDSLHALDLQLDRVQNAIAESRNKVADTRTSARRWSNWSAVAGSVFLVWMALGQIALLRDLGESMVLRRSSYAAGLEKANSAAV